MEADDFIEVNSTVFHKPFVEKPVSAEDHNVYIYFPTSAGGGSQRLFRKVRHIQHVLYKLLVNNSCGYFFFAICWFWVHASLVYCSHCARNYTLIS